MKEFRPSSDEEYSSMNNGEYKETSNVQGLLSFCPVVEHKESYKTRYCDLVIRERIEFEILWRESHTDKGTVG